jgi:hypothetical protein
MKRKQIIVHILSRSPFSLKKDPKWPEWHSSMERPFQLPENAGSCVPSTLHGHTNILVPSFTFFVHS